MTPITYRQAAKLLNCSTETINKAVHEGRLSKAPSINKEQKVIREQVLLFKGKSQIRKSNLSKEDQKKWDFYKDAYEQYTSDQQSIQVKLFMLDKIFVGELIPKRLSNNPSEIFNNLDSKDTQTHLITLLEMIETAARNKQEQIMMDIVNQIALLTRSNAKLFLDAMFYVLAVLHEYDMLQESSFIREMLSVA